MRRRSKFGLHILLPAAIAILGVRLVLTLAQSGGAPSVPPQAPATSPQVIKAEANLVLVDVIATDKKGGYIKDLEVKEFQVFEDNRPQEITSFSRPVELRVLKGQASLAISCSSLMTPPWPPKTKCWHGRPQTSLWRRRRRRSA